MGRRDKEPYAKRPVAIEYYKQLTHAHPTRRGFCMDATNALVKAGEHLDRGHAIMAIAVQRVSGRVLWTRIKIGRHNITKPGDAPNEPVRLKIDIPAVDLEDR